MDQQMVKIHYTQYMHNIDTVESEEEDKILKCQYHQLNIIVYYQNIYQNILNSWILSQIPLPFRMQIHNWQKDENNIKQN